MAKMTEQEMKDFMKEFTDVFIKQDGFKNVVTKINVFGKAVADLGKEEKTIAFFKALVEKDTTMLKTLDAVSNGGGYLLPTAFINDVIDQVAKAPNSLRALCRVIPVKERSGSIPALTQGAVVKFASSDSATTDDKKTDLVFNEISYNVKRIEGFNLLSKDLLNDSPVAMYGIIVDSYAEGLITCENSAILNGGGETDYTGVRTAVTQTVEVKTAGTLAPEDLIGLQYKIASTFRKNCVYIADTKVISKIASMKDGDGRLLYNPNTTSGVATFNGYKVIEVTEMPSDLGTSGTDTEIVFGNFTQGYVLFDKNEYATETNESIKWMENQIVCRFQNRADGKVAIPKAFVRLTKVPTV